MSSLAILVGIIFWAPVTVVVFYHLLSDVEFLQRSEFSLRKLNYTLRWDMQRSQRKFYLTVAKTLGIIGILTFVWSPSSLVPILTVLALFVIWAGESLLILERIYLGNLVGPRVDWRTFVIMVISAFVFTILPTIFTLTVASDALSNSQLAISDLSSIVPAAVTSGLEIPAVYIFLLFSGLLAIVYDLGAPLWAVLLVVITKPVQFFRNRILVAKAAHKLSVMPDLKIIGICGSFGKTATKHILQHILSENLKVEVSPHSTNGVNSVARTVLGLNPQTQVLIVEMNAYKPGQIAQISKLLRPHMAIITSIDENHLGLFGTLENTVHAKTEVLDYLQPDGVAVFNADDPDLFQAFKRSRHHEIFVFSTEEAEQRLKDNQLTLNTYNWKASKQQLTLNTPSVEIPISLQSITKSMAPFWSLAIAASLELGIDVNNVTSRLAEFKLPTEPLQSAIGDDNTTLWSANNIHSARGVSVALEYLADTIPDLTDKNVVMAITEIHGLGKHRATSYSKLQSELQNFIDVLITPDRDLYKTLQINNFKTKLILANIDELNYAVRQHATTGSHILLINTPPQLSADLAAETSV